MLPGNDWGTPPPEKKPRNPNNTVIITDAQIVKDGKLLEITVHYKRALHLVNSYPSRFAWLNSLQATKANGLKSVNSK